MKNIILILFSLFPILAFAQVPEQEAYLQTLRTRTQKIVEKLGIPGEGLQLEIRDIIVDQYRSLRDIHETRDAKKDSVKSNIKDKPLQDKEIKAIENEAAAKMSILHRAFIGSLCARLTHEQVEEVKDGMTYHVMPITYKGFLDMLQDLTGEQKIQIKAYLWEAREHALDGGSSEEKHWWFGKYKGRINNYLAAQGYDLKKESEAWHKRLKAQEETKKSESK